MPVWKCEIPHKTGIYEKETAVFIGRTDLSDSDPQLMRTSLQKLMAVKKNYHVLPGHGPATTLDQEKQTNPYLSGRYCI